MYICLYIIYVHLLFNNNLFSHLTSSQTKRSSKRPITYFVRPEPEVWFISDNSLEKLPNLKFYFTRLIFQFYYTIMLLFYFK